MECAHEPNSTRMVRQIVGRLHASTRDREVVRYVRSRLTPEARRSLAARADRHGIYRQALIEHHANGDLYARVVEARI